MALMKCPECGKEISDKAKACPNCGYTFEITKFCKFCGQKIPFDSVICVKCGRQIENQNGVNGITINNAANANASSSSLANVETKKATREPKEVDRKTALLLCIFAGYLGAHKFYEGKIGIGVLYLFTFGLFGIGWVIDIFTIMGKEDTYYV